jgi:hypothetical protein
LYTIDLSQEQQQQQQQQQQQHTVTHVMDEDGKYIDVVHNHMSNATDEDHQHNPAHNDNDNGKELALTTRSLWRRRHARSIGEGIRREKTSELSDMLKKAHQETSHANRHLFARTITGFISAVAEEAEGLEVEVNSRRGSPIWEKRIDSIQINFSRLGFRPLRLGGLHNAIDDPQLEVQDSKKSSNHNNDTVSEDLDITYVKCMIEAFQRIDADNSGTLDRDEIAMAMDLVTSADSDDKLLTALASELVELYDTNGDGVVDFEEYELMVNDMAALRKVQLETKEDGEQKVQQPSKGRWRNFGRGTHISSKDEASDSETIVDATQYVTDDESDDKALPVVKGTGTITVTDLKLDLRQLLFGFVPLVSKITPGGPLVLEPFTATVHGSLNKDDIMESLLVDMGLRRLVARALRRRTGSFRDIMDGAVFYGRSWNMASAKAPVIEVPRLTSVEFDKQDRLVITGRAIIRHSPDAPVIENGFKVRTKLGTRKNGRVIRLEQPELALVVECPQSLESR